MLILLSLGEFMIGPSSFGQLALPAAISSEEWRVVRMAERDGNSFHFRGTGIALIRHAKVYVIANEHLLESVKNRDNVYADFPPPVDAHPAHLLSANVAADIAVFETEVLREATGEQVGQAIPGQAIFIVGFDDNHMMRNDLNIQTGTITRVGSWDNERHLLTPARTTEALEVPAMLISAATCHQGGSGRPRLWITRADRGRGKSFH